jgi:hypothetical protein
VRIGEGIGIREGERVTVIGRIVIRYDGVLTVDF